MKFEVKYRDCIKMNRDKIGTQTCYVHQHNLVGTLIYIACLCPNLVSVHIYAYYTPNILIYLSLINNSH